MATFALAGSGAMASVWAQTLAALPDHRLVAVASRQTGHARSRARAWQAQCIDPAELPGSAQLTVVANAPPAHADDALRAAAGGSAVIIEAPLSATLAEADKLVAAVNGGARMAYAENLLFAPLVRDALRRAPSVGPLHYLEARVSQRPLRHATRDAGWGGGVLFDLGAHVVAVLLALAGSDPAVAVRAELQAASADPLAADDQARLELTLRSGARAVVELSWRGISPQWDLQVASAHRALRLELLPDPHLEQLGVDLARPARRYPELESGQLEVFGYIDQLHELAAELLEGRAPYTSVSFGRHVLDVLCGAYRSAFTGQAESLPFTGPRELTPWQLWRGTSSSVLTGR